MVRAPIHLLFDAHQLGRHQTGNETYVRGLLDAFRSQAELVVTALIERQATGDDAVAGYRRQDVPRSGTLRLAAMSLASHRLHPDILHAIYFAPPVARAPLVLTVHDISYELYPQFFSRIERLRGQTLVRAGTRRARFVVTVSETSRRDIIERYGLAPEVVVAIPNGVSSRFHDRPPRPITDIGDRPVRILAVGTLQPRKNLSRLLSAVRRVASTRRVHLRVIGPDGYQAETIRQELAGMAVVDVVGYVTDDALVDEYESADMLVYPSLYEGFGLPVVEAMACGTPVITSTGGALPEVAGDAALIVDPLDEVAIGDAILRLSDDVQIRSELSSRGRVRARAFTWEASAARHLDVYREAAGT